MLFFFFSPNFNRTFCKQIEDPDHTLHNTVSDLGLSCLPMSHKKDARLILESPKQVLWQIVKTQMKCHDAAFHQRLHCLQR